MIRILTATLALACLTLATSASARSATLITCTDRGCASSPVASPRLRTARHSHRQARGRVHRGAYVRVASPRNNAPVPAAQGIGASLAGLPGELIAKIQEIVGACPGFQAISTFRPGAIVAGTNKRSLHGFHKAADIAGPNYACAYAHLQGWPGGYSTDSGRVAHIHLSWAPGSGEWGARFVHGGGHRVRHARHRGRGRSG